VAKDEDKPAKKAKEKGKGDKGKGKGKGQTPGALRLATHPRAPQQIAMAKGWGGLLGFVFVGWTSHAAGATVFESGLRAIAGGLALYVLAWAAAVVVWQQIAKAEVERARRRAVAEMEVMAGVQEQVG
jgi:hypothetical protein